MWTRNAIIASLLASTIGIVCWWQYSVSASGVDNVIPMRRDAGYVASNACVKCHQEQHASWYDSYHRTMTQLASAETIVASFDDRELHTAGQTGRIYRKGDAFWVKMVDPAWERRNFERWAASRSDGQVEPSAVAAEQVAAVTPRIDAQVVMTTGSHHFQVYWVRGREGRELWQFPWRYHIASQRWIHRKDVFLAPPEWQPGMWFRTWNNQCIYCHSTGPVPGEDPHTGLLTGTRTAELGIACEACHGPGEEHIAFQRARGGAGDGGALGGDDANSTDPIVNPASLSSKASSQVCGSCHSHFQHHDGELAQHGPKYRPGDNLFHFGMLELPENDDEVMSRFWGDGTNRSGGREFSGMSTSECYRVGEMSCVTCHSMHESDPNDQLKSAAETGAVCLQCHAEFQANESLIAHTHHVADSSGSNCLNCHMPHTNYALFKAIRSHAIQSPQVTSLTSNSRPNACNLCHLDQTVAWTARHLEAWYDLPGPDLSDDEANVPAGVLWALKGDAGQRVITAWHLGWSPALRVIGRQASDGMLPILLQLMKDPYAAVRWVASASRGTMTESSGEVSSEVEFPFDDWKRAEGWVDTVWASHVRERTEGNIPNADAGGLRAPSLGIEAEDWRRLLGERDHRPVAGVE